MTVGCSEEGRHFDFESHYFHNSRDGRGEAITLEPASDTFSLVRTVNALCVTIQKQWPFFVSVGLHAAVIGIGAGLLSSPAEFAMNAGEPGSGSLGTVFSVEVVTEVLDEGSQEVAVQTEEQSKPEEVEQELETQEPSPPEPEISVSPVRKVEPQKVEKKPAQPKRAKKVTLSEERKTLIETSRARMAPARSSVPAETGKEASGSGSGGNAGAAVAAQPDYLENPPPPYPKASRRAGEEGTVILTAEVNAAGRVDDVMVKKSSSHPRLDRAALDAVKRWRFKPKKVAGFPVASRVDVPITFVLRG